MSKITVWLSEPGLSNGILNKVIEFADHDIFKEEIETLSLNGEYAYKVEVESKIEEVEKSAIKEYDEMMIKRGYYNGELQVEHEIDETTIQILLETFKASNGILVKAFLVQEK